MPTYAITLQSRREVKVFVLTIESDLGVNGWPNTDAWMAEIIVACGALRVTRMEMGIHEASGDLWFDSNSVGDRTALILHLLSQS